MTISVSRDAYVNEHPNVIVFDTPVYEISPGGGALFVCRDTGVIGNLYFSSVSSRLCLSLPIQAQTRYAGNFDVCAGTPKWPIRSSANLGHVDTRFSDIRIVAGSPAAGYQVRRFRSTRLLFD